MTIAAAVDVGSNTLRLLIARVDRGSGLQTLLLDRHVTRLSQNLTPGEPLDPRARQRTLQVLIRFGELIRGHGVERVFGGATAAVRLASDGDDFLDQVEREAEFRIEKISGEQEAFLTALGVLSDLDSIRGPVLVVDPGGRSTEFIPVEDRRIKPGLSLDIGVVGLCEDFLSQAPAPPGQLAALEKEIRGKLERALAFYPPVPGLTLAGTAGTVTTIAAMLLELDVYQPDRITGYRITAGQVEGLIERLAPLDLEKRRLFPGLEQGREDVILPGLVLVQALMRMYSQEEMKAVDAGLLEGHIINGIGLSPDS